LVIVFIFEYLLRKALNAAVVVSCLAFDFHSVLDHGDLGEKAFLKIGLGWELFKDIFAWVALLWKEMC
jgi:hypothetical protein